MTRKRKKCSVDGCLIETHGDMCVAHSYNKRKIHQSRDEYARWWHIKRKYNMEQDEFYLYWVAQKGKCFICGIDMTAPKKKRGQDLTSVSVDHCHTTGKVRGLLCSGCNKGIGLLKDDIQILKNAIKYLEDIK